MICPNCNKTIKDGAKFCGHCGADISLAKHSITDDSVDTIIVNAYALLSKSSFDDARELFDSATRKDAKNVQAMLGKLLCDLQLHNESELSTCSVDFGENLNYRSLLVFADSDTKARLSAYQRKAAERAFELKRENTYNEACESLTNGNFSKALVLFEELDGWKDSSEKIELCNRGLEQQRLENEKKAEEKRIQEEIQAKKIKKYAIVFSAALAVFIAAILLINNFIIPMSKFNNAEKLLKEGNYSEAYSILNELDNFNNADERILQDKYDRAMKNIEEGNYDAAYSLLNQIGTYNKANEFIISDKIQRAKKLYDMKEYSSAHSILVSIDNADSETVKLRKSAFKKMIYQRLDEYDKASDTGGSITYLKRYLNQEDFDKELTDELNQRSGTYRNNLIIEADNILRSTGYQAALDFIDKGFSVLPNDSALVEKKEEYEGYIPVKLEDLDFGNRFGLNDREDIANGAGEIISECWELNEYIELKTYSKFNKLAATVTPSNKFGRGYFQVARFEIYADDKLIYTKDEIMRGTPTFKVNVDITNAKSVMLKVVGIGGDHGGFDWANKDMLIYDATVYKEIR